jgi:hypothetical protein
MAHPEACRGDEDRGEVVSGRLLVSRGDLAEVIEVVDEALDQVALALDGGINGPLHLAVALGRDVPEPAMCLDQVQHGAGVMAAIGHDIAGARMEGQRPCHRCLVGGLSGREGDGDGQSAPLHHRVDLGAHDAPDHGLFDEYQSKENAKHTLRALEENARQGYWSGSLPPVGYRVVDAEKRGAKIRKVLEIDPLHADTVRLMFRLPLEGDGTRAGASARCTAS